MKASKNALNILNRLAGLALVCALALVSGGCVGNDELNEARKERDEFRGELQRLHLSNDDLKREISSAYASCDLIGNQLTVMAAMNIHDQYTDKLGRPVLPKPLEETRSAPGPRPVQETRPRERPEVGRPEPVQEIKPVVEKKPAPPLPPSRPDMTGADFGGYVN